MTISLAFLAPDFVKAAVEGSFPRGVGVERLRDAPAKWSRQFEILGLNPPWAPKLLEPRFSGDYASSKKHGRRACPLFALCPYTPRKSLQPAQITVLQHLNPFARFHRSPGDVLDLREVDVVPVRHVNGATRVL